nr:hypothetical protein [uncultured Porphyromonas sp.]
MKRAPSPDSIQHAIATNTHLQRYLAMAIEKGVQREFASPVISQSKAYRMFGRANVERWKALCLVQERRAESGRINYYTAELLEAQDKSYYR